MNTPDLTYHCHDGIWWRFTPESQAGVEAFNVMAAADPQGQVAFLPPALPGVLLQLRAAGLSVRKAKAHKPLSLDELDAMLEELGA